MLNPSAGHARFSGANNEVQVVKPTNWWMRTEGEPEEITVENMRERDFRIGKLAGKTPVTVIPVQKLPQRKLGGGVSTVQEVQEKRSKAEVRRKELEERVRHKHPEDEGEPTTPRRNVTGGAGRGYDYRGNRRGPRPPQRPKHRPTTSPGCEEGLMEHTLAPLLPMGDMSIIAHPRGAPSGSHHAWGAPPGSPSVPSELSSLSPSYLKYVHPSSMGRVPQLELPDK